MNPGHDLSTPELREWNKNLVNEIRNNKISVSFPYNGNEYNADDVSVANMISATITSLILKSKGADYPPGFTWRTFDNRNIPINADGVIAMSLAYFQYRAVCYQRSWELKSQIDLLSGQDLLDLDLSLGWPS